MKPIQIIGVNGDRLPLGQEFKIGTGATFGSARPRVNYRSAAGGRRVETIRQDVVLSRFDLMVEGRTVLEHDQRRERAINALRSVEVENGAEVMFILERTDGTRRAQVGYDLGDDLPIADHTVRRSRIPIVLESVEAPYWIGLEAETASTSIGVADSTPWVGEMPLGGPPPPNEIPMGWEWDIGGYYIADANSKTVTVNNEGALNTWPMWVITGPASSIELAHERTGLVTSWAGTLTAGEELRIVTDPNQRNVTQGADPAWEGVGLDSRMSPLLNGENRVRVSLAGGTDGQTLIEVTANPRFTSA